MKLDVRTKLIIAAILSTLALVYQDVVVLVALMILTLATLLLLRVSLHVFLDFRKFFFLYLILIVIQSLFVRGGEPILAIGGLHLLTTESLVYGAVIILRFLILSSSGLILLNCSMPEMLLAMSKMKIPYEIVFMIQIGIRFIPVLVSELANIFDTIQLRGVDLRKVYKRKVIKVYISIFTPLIYSIWQKTEQLSILLELRGFRCRPTRSYYKTISMTAVDYVVISLSLMVAIIFVFTVFTCV
jgi:energy-coupling factor transport system permease protein